MAPNKVDLVAARAASKLAQLQARGIIAAPAESASTAQPNSCQTAIPGVPVLSNAAPNTKQYVRQCVVVPAYCTLEEIATRSGVLALREVPLPLPPLPIVQPQRPASGTASTGTIGDLDSCSLASFDSHIGVYSIDGSRAWLAAADSNCSTPYTACTAETPSSSLTHCGFDACYAGEQPCPAYLAAGHGAVPPVPPGFERLMPMAGAAAAALYEDASDDDLLPMPLRTAVLPSVAAAANPATGAGLQASRQAQQAAGVQFYYQAGSGYHRMGAAAAAASDCQAADAQHHGEHQSTAMQLQQLQRARQLQQQGLLRAVSLPLPPALAPMPLMFGPSRGTAITAAIRRGLGAAFERQPELFRQLYGFELHWWAGIRGRPVGEDDLLRVMAFKDYAVVLVRTDPYAAPALAPPPPTLNAKRPSSAVAAQRQLIQQRRRRRLALNAPMSALLGQRVHGNAVVIRLWVDFASNHAANASSLSSVSSGSSCWVPPEDRILLAPVSVTSLRNELLNAETVAWHLQQSDAMMSEMRLGPERQAGWLLRLPRTPLDMRGDPDTIAALRLATEAAGLPPMAPGKAAAMLAAAAEAARKAAAEDEEGGAGSDALGASAVSVPGIPQELAPLLRCVRCTSPWCHPGRRGAALLCPFGHMWRHLDPVAPLMASNQGAYEPSPTVAASMAPPVLNAARPAALQAAAAAPPYPGTSAAAGSATGGPVQVAAPAAAGGAGLQALLQPVSALVAEPCESLVSYLSDPDTWCGPLTDLVAAAVEGGMDGAALAAAVATSGSAAEHSTAGSLACNSNTAAQAEVDDHDQPGEAGAAKPQEDEREAMYAAATAAVRPEGWPFYLGFCAQGPQCTRCHSGHELRLATVVQQLKSAVLKKKPAGPTNRARNVGQLAPSKRAAAVAAAVAAAAAAGKGIATRSGFAALEVEEAPARDTDSDMSDWEGEPEREQPIEPAPAADAEDEPAAASRAAATAATSYVRAVTAAVAAVEVAAASRTARLSAVATAAEAAAATAAAVTAAAPPARAPAEVLATASTAPASTWSIVSAWYEAATAAAAVAPSDLPAAPAFAEHSGPALEQLPAVPAGASTRAAPVVDEALAAVPVQSEASAKRLNASAAPWPAALSTCNSQGSSVAASVEAASCPQSSIVNRSLNPAAQPWRATAAADGVERSLGSSGSMDSTTSPSSSTSESAPKSLNPAALPWRAAVSSPQAAAPATAEPATAPKLTSAGINEEEDQAASTGVPAPSLEEATSAPAEEQAAAATAEDEAQEEAQKEAQEEAQEETQEEEHAAAKAACTEPEQPEASRTSAKPAAEPAHQVPASTASASAPDPAALPSARLSEPLPPAMPAPAPAPGIRSWAAIAAKPPPEPELDDEEWYGEDQEQEEEAPQPAAAVPISFCGQWAVMRMPGRGLKKAAPAAAAPTPKPAADPVVEQPEVSKEDDAGESVLAPAVQDAAEVCHVPPAPSTPPAATGSSGVDAEMSGSESRASASAGGVVAEVGDSDAFEAVVAAAVAAGKFNWADEAEQEEQELAAAAEAEAEEKVCRVEQQRRELEAEVAVGWQQAESPKRWRKEERQEEAVNVVARQELRPEIRAPPPAIPPPPPHQRPKPAATAITYTSTTSSTAAAQRTGDIPCVSFAAALAAAAAAQRARDGLPAESDGEIEELDEDEDASDELDSDEERLRQEEEERRRVQQQVAELQQRWKEQRRAQQEEEQKKAETIRQRQAVAHSEAAASASSQVSSTQETEPTSKAATCNALSNGFEPAPAPGTTISTTIATSTRADAENAPAAQPHTQQQRGEAVAAEPMYEAPRYHAPPQYTQPTQQQPHFYQQQAIGYMAMPGGGGYVALMAPTSLAPMQVPQMPIAVPLGGGGGGSAGGSGDGAGGLGQAGVQGPPSWQLPPQAGWPAGSQVTWVPVIQPPQQGVFGALPALPGAGTYGFMPSVYGATPPMQPTYQAPAYHSGYQPSYVQAQQPTQAQPYMPHHVAQQTQPKAQLPYFMQPRTDARSGRLKDKLAAAAAGTTMAATYVQPASAAGAEDEGDVDDLLHLLVPESR